jgi:hypothetical protein
MRLGFRAFAMLFSVALLVIACGDDDAGLGDTARPAGDDVVEEEVDDEQDDVGEEVGEEVDDARRGDAGPFEGDTATLRMANLVGASEGGIDVDVVGPAADFTSDHVYGSVRYGEIAELEFPAGWDARLFRSGTAEAVSGSSTVHDDTDTGQVVVFRDDGATRLGAFPEDRKPGYSIVGMASAIADDDPQRRWRYSSADGVCLFSVGDEVPAPMATAAEGGDTRGILSVGQVDDFVWYVEPGQQTLYFADAADDVFSQGDDCSSRAFEVDIDAPEGKAVFVALYGASDDVQATVYYED